MAIEKQRKDCYNRGWRSKCYCVGGCFSCIGAWVTANRPCPALLFASLLLSYHVFLALTSLLFFGKNYFCRKAEPLRHASRASSPFRGAFFCRRLCDDKNDRAGVDGTGRVVEQQRRIPQRQRSTPVNTGSKAAPPQTRGLPAT